MPTSTTFDAMLRRYMPYELLVEEMKKRNYFWSQVEKDEDWLGGTLEVPYEAGEASSLSFGALTAANDIAEGTNVMGTISGYRELWGTMLFNERDLDRHNGNMEQSALKLIPGKIDQFVDRMGQRVSISLLGDGSIARATANGAVGGTITVDRPERFSIGEKIVVDDDDSSPVTGYITGININTGVLNIQTARSAGSNVDLSGYTTAQNAKIFLPNQQAEGFTSLASQLLSAANGGATNLFGAAKTTAPFLQSINVDGSGFTANTLLDDLFAAYFQVHRFGKGNPTEMIVSYGLFKNIARQLETNRDYIASDKKAGMGWRSVNLLGVDGECKITAVREMPDNLVHVLDWKGMKFHGSKFFDRKRHMDGGESFLVRNTTGYQYIVDCKFYGELVVNKPAHQGIIYGIPASCAV